MKTNVEISEWLKSQPWYSNFVTNLTNSNEDVKESLNNTFIEGELGESTLLEAFNWADAPEGYMFWNEANRTLLDFLGK